MGLIRSTLLAATTMLLTYGSAQATAVPPFKGNDTGGIIAYDLARTSDPRLIAVEHCAKYGKVAKFLGVQAYYGGYVSFACRWVPAGSLERPLRARY